MSKQIVATDEANRDDLARSELAPRALECVKSLKEVVGAEGSEPPTSCTQRSVGLTEKQLKQSLAVPVRVLI